MLLGVGLQQPEHHHEVGRVDLHAEDLARHVDRQRSRPRAVEAAHSAYCRSSASSSGARSLLFAYSGIRTPQRRRVHVAPHRHRVDDDAHVVELRERFEFLERQVADREEARLHLVERHVELCPAQDRLDVEDVPAAEQRREQLARVRVQELEHLLIRADHVVLERVVDDRGRAPVDELLLEVGTVLGVHELLDDLRRGRAPR